MDDSAAGVLLVGGAEEELRVFETITRELGARLVHAPSAAEALGALFHEDFALILIDASTPQRGGFEAAARLSELDRERQAPFLFLGTANEAQARVSRGYDLGAADWLNLPLDRRIVRAKVRVFVELHRRAARQRAEARSQAREEIERQREDFLSVASHELCTPISALKLQVQSAQRLLKRAPNEALRVIDKLEVANRQVDRLTRLVGALLDVFRCEEGRMPIEREELDLGEVVREVVGRLGGELERAQAKVELEIAPSVTGLWDRRRVEQVVVNLLHNAVKYGGDKPILVSVAAADGMARIVVADQGIGIAPGDQGRIFERFERAVSAQAYGGMGIGLFIVDQIVKAHGGAILVSSKPGAGSAFTVVLPREPGQVAAGRSLRRERESAVSPVITSGAA